MEYSPYFLSVVKEIDALMFVFSHTKKDIGYGFRLTFANGHWVDVIDYKKQGTTILRVGRGARLVRRYPLLYHRFDQVMGVLAKVKIGTMDIFYQKRVGDVLQLLHDAPGGIGAFD